MPKTNLNHLCVYSELAPPVELLNHGTSGSVTKVFFRDIEQNLIQQIRNYPVVVGCVAWLTHPRILDALATCIGVSIVVQKEDFLRPDSDSPGWKKELRRQYEALRSIGDRYEVSRLISYLSYATSQEFQPVRCLGNHNRDKDPAFPRMHNKFIVFCDRVNYSRSCDNVCRYTGHECDSNNDTLNPRAVWTGSFNFTQNATNSLENAVLISDPVIASAYFAEWEQLICLSEPLDWTDDWCAPEWRIGT